VKEILAMFPISWLSAKAIYLTSFMDIIISAGSRVSGAVTSMHVLGMNKDNGPKEQIKLAKIIFFVMIIGIVVVGIVHLSIAYHNPGSLDGKVSPIQGKSLSTFSAELLNFDRGNWANPVHNRIGHTIFGFIFALFLQIACLISPLWPFHPIGILLADTSFIKIAWPSIFVGWSVRRLILAYGGAQVYRQAKPVFLGLIVGHILAGIIWAIVPAVLIAMGGDAAEIGKIYVTPHF
jgi:hypothetical protein